MSLKQVLIEKTITARYNLLSNYLKNNELGPISDSESRYFKEIFNNFYTPDNEYEKFEIDNINNVSIVLNSYGKKCFSICVNNIHYPTSIKRLSGSNRTKKMNLRRALRNAIKEQINEFKLANPLDVNACCPIITTQLLNPDAQVDHETPFHKLADEWINNNKINNNKIDYYLYDLNDFDYVLQEPYLTNWREFHYQKAKLRWVSKDGNKIAHKLC